MSSGRLDSAQLDADILQRMHRQDVPSVAVAVVSAHDVLYVQSYGLLNSDEPALPVTPTALFRIASLTKPLVGTMLLRLQAQGLLDLQTSVQQLVPAFRFQNPAYGAQITLHHLLTHTSGLQPAGVTGAAWGAAALGHLIETELAEWPFLAPPGTLHAYSNFGLCVAGAIAEIVTQTPFAQLMEDLLFKPLGMTQTTFDPLLAMTYPVAQAHNLRPDGQFAVQRPFIHNAAYTPAGGAFSTVGDLARFVQLHLNQGSHQGTTLLAHDDIASMHRSHVELYGPNWLAGYGLTFFTGHYKQVPVAWHGGSIGPWWGGRLTIAPKHGIGIVLLVSRIADFRSDTQAITESIMDQLLMLPAAEQVPAPTSALPLADQQAEEFCNPYAECIRIQRQEGHCVLVSGEQTVALTRIRPNVYADAAGAYGLGFIAGPRHPEQYVLLNSVPYQRSATE